MFNGFAVNVTKYTSATNRCVMDQLRVVIIWAFFLMFSGVGHETFSIQKVAGFVMITLGVLFFNKILHLNWCLGEPQEGGVSLLCEESA